MQLEKVNRMLIVRLSSLGDILLTTPLIRTIKQYYPNIEIDFVVREAYKDLLLLNPYLQNILIYNNYKDKLKTLKNKISPETLKKINSCHTVDFRCRLLICQDIA